MSSDVSERPRSQFLPAAGLVSAALLFLTALHFAHRTGAEARYRECSTLALSNPAKARDIALAWRVDHAGSPIARHCEALALFGLKDYTNSATLLEELAKEPAQQKPKLAADLLVQAATARHAAGDDLMAVQDLDNALTLDANNEQAKTLMEKVTSGQ